jgi:hypothetical protein
MQNCKTSARTAAKTGFKCSLLFRPATLAAILMLAAVLSSCTHRKEPMQKESGVVVEKQYFPDTKQTVTGTGFTSKGSVVFTTHNIGEDEKYIVIFKCSHGVVFSINKPELYGKLNKGDSVIIDYYEIVNKKGEIKDLDFVDANAVRK